MVTDFLLQVFRQNPDKPAIIWRDREFTFQYLLERLAHWHSVFAAEKLQPGAVVAIEADFSPNSVALFLALTGHGCILVPLTTASAAKREEFIETAQVEVIVSVDASDQAAFTRPGRTADHEIYQKLRQTGHPGLVLFSSGSTGKSKAAVHDLSYLLEKFHVQRRCLRTITFLLYDHIGGVNTMLYTLSNAGCMVAVQARSPDSVLAAVARHKVELLPTSPTFLNLVLLSEAWKRHDLGSLKTVTYGTEPMPESTLQRFHQLFPGIQLLQTYGLSELGILRSKSRSSDSLWVQIGGEGFQTRVVEGILQIKARSAMLGYLNAPSPFTEDGWFNTGDAVEVDGEFLRILGRKSEIINVGGEKVFPGEVESVLLQMEGVQEASVRGERSAILGQQVVAVVTLARPEPLNEFRARLVQFCRPRLQNYKIPQKILVVEGPLHNERFKMMRR